MNIRNLLLTSILFCTAPVVCIETEVKLTKQEQEIIKKWVKQVNQLPSESKKIVKVVISLTKDYVSLALNKIMHVGRKSTECAQEMIEGYYVFGERVEKEFKSLKKKVKKSRDVGKISQGVDEVLESCPLAGITVTENIGRTIKETIFTIIFTISIGDDIFLSFEKEITGVHISRATPEGGLKSITEEDVANMKRVLAGYLFALECL